MNPPTAPRPTAPAGAAPPRRVARRLAALAALAAGLALLGWGARRGWLAWQGQPPPGPPDLALGGVERPVAEAVEAALAGVRRQPRSPQAWGYLGKVLYANGFEPEAGPCFARAEALDPDDPRWPYLRGLLRKGEDDVLAHLRRAAALADRHDPDRAAVPRLELAEALLERGRGEEAERLLGAVERREPDNPRAHYHLGLLAYARGDLRGAVAHLSRLTDSPYARRKACAQLAVIYGRLRDARAAAEYGRRSLDEGEDAPWPDPYREECAELAVNNRGNFDRVKNLQAAGRHLEAARLLEKMSTVEGGDVAEARLTLAANLTEMGRYDDAERLLRQVLRAQPDNLRACYALGLLLVFQGEQLLRDSPAQGDRARDKFREAVTWARRVVEAQPGHGFAHAFLGRALLGLGQRREAIAALRVAVSCRPEVGEIHRGLAEALAEDGRDAEALEQFEAAVRCAPDDPGAERALRCFKERRARKGQ